MSAVRGRRGFVQYGHFADKGGEGVLQMRTPHFLAQKTSEFSKFMVCPHEQGEGLSKCRHFADKGEGVIFSDFVRTSFMDGP